MRDIKNLINNVKRTNVETTSNQKSIVFEKIGQSLSIPKDFSGELYLMCFRDGFMLADETVGLGDYMGTMVYVGGEISYETILKNRGLTIDNVAECYLTLYSEPMASGVNYQNAYDIYSAETGSYIGKYVPGQGKFRIPIKKLYDTSGICNFYMVPAEEYIGLAIFDQNNYAIEIIEKTEEEDFYDTTFFSNKPDFQQNYFEGNAANAGDYSVNKHDGRLSFSKALFSLEGNRLPMSLRMVYNPFIHSGIHGIFTDNWKFNFEQYVYEQNDDYIYIDNDFRRHVFKPLLDNAGNRVNGQYYDTEHSGLLLQTNNGTVTITDGRLFELKFTDKRLAEILEYTGDDTYNTLTITYNGGIISTVTDGMGRTTKFAKSGSIITITMPSGNKITINESTGLGLTVQDADSRIYKYSYSMLNDVNLLSSVSEETKRSVKFEYEAGLRVKKITVSNPKITLATYEFTYNLFANHTDIQKTELNKTILERYSMTEEGRPIYSCELQDEKSYALAFRTKEDYDVYSAALRGDHVSCVFSGNKDSVKITSGKELNATAESNSNFVAFDGEDVVLVANILVNTQTESNEEVDIEVWYGIPSIGYPISTVQVKRIKDPQTIIVPIPKHVEGFAQIYKAADYTRLFKFTTGTNLPFGLTIFNVGYYFTNIAGQVECISQNTGSDVRFNDDPNNVTWYKLVNPKIEGVTGNDPVKMTSDDWRLSLDDYARNSADYIVWCKERTEARKCSSPVKFTFTGEAGTFSHYINEIQYATITEQGINTLYDSFTYNKSSETEYIKETRTLVRNESSMRAGKDAVTCLLYFDKLYRQTKTINSLAMEEVFEYDAYGNITSSVTQNGSLNMKESFAYGNAAGVSGGGQYLIRADEYMLGQTLSNKYRYEQNTGRLKSSISPVGQSRDYTYEHSGELKTLSSTLNGQISKNELSYDFDRIKTAKHNDFVYNFTYGNTYEELRTVTAGNYKLCDQRQESNYRTVTDYPDDQNATCDTDHYGRQKEIGFYGEPNYQGIVDFRYGLPNQPNVDNAQSQLLGIDLHLYSGTHVYSSATFDYEANGNLQKLSWFDLYSLEFTYDDENRMKTQTYSDADTTVISEFTYWDGDALTESHIENTGNRIGEDLVSTTQDDYDGLNRLYKRTRIFGAQTNTETYSYVNRTVNGTGTTCLPASLEQSVDPAYNESFAYDSDGNIISINKNSGKVTYEYDKLDRLVRENNPLLDKTYTYEYDKGGNITAKKEYAYTTGALSSPAVTHPYTYDSTYKDLLTAYDGQTITYDETARPLSYKGKQLRWMLGKLFQYGDTAFDYLYDNTRLTKSSDNRSVTYHYYNGKLLGEQRSGNGETKNIRYLYDQGGIIGFALDDTVYRYIKNLQGDIIAIYCGATKIAEYAYDAWGNCTVLQDTDGIGTFNAIRYRGYYYDVETGLYYLMSHYYDPATGRFLSPDDVSYLDPETINGLNLFAYCGNNPVMNTDPEGHAWWQWLVAAVVVVAAVAISVATAGVAATVIAGTVGAAVSVGAELSADLIDDGQINRGVTDYIGSAVGGFVSGLGGNILSASMFGGTGDLVTGLISGEVNSIGSALHTFGSSAITSGIMASGSKLFRHGIAKAHYNKIIGNSTRNIKINKKLKQAGFGKVKIGRDGIGAVLNEISNSPIHGAINGIFSNTLSYGISLFREIF